MNQDHLLIGTTKGLINYKIENGILLLDSVDFEGLSISAIHQHFDGTIYIAISHKHWGEKLFTKGLRDKDWKELSVPRFDTGLTTVKGKPAKLKQIWDIHHGGMKYPDRLWLATEPGALFISEDRGRSFHIVSSLWNHPTRVKNKQWFGAGKDLPFVHSIIVDPENTDCVYVSVSCAGVFKTEDSGESWIGMNEGMEAAYLPNPRPVAGYDPHLMLMSNNDHKVLWQQNHCGIYRSENGGHLWNNISGSDGFPDYGFALAIEKANVNEAWVIPVQDETNRTPAGLRLRVLKTSDKGETWKDSSKGLPLDHFFGIVLRNGFVKHDDMLAFGTTNGNVYFSDNRGDNWKEITSSLAKINYLSFVKQ